MPNIYIIGNSGAARECYWILQDVLAHAPGLANYYHFKGFFSWQGYQGDLKELHNFYLGDVDSYQVVAEDMFIIGIGKPSLRREIFNFMKGRSAIFMNLIHSWSDICPSAKLGEGNIFQRGSTVFCNAKIGNGNYINGACNVSHDASIGDFNFLGPFSMVLGGAEIGSGNHLGPHGVILDHAKIGSGNILAANSTIYKGCKNNCRMMGSPALKIGDNEEPWQE